ncbi:MAG: class I SAM-dependent methyltransferase, partial [Polyangiaceae bacterium]
MFSEKLTPADAAILETFVVPRYLSLFGDLMLEMILVGESARIAHLGCRTGYPDLKLYERVDGVDIVGVDSSLPALELARNKAAVLGDVSVQYLMAESLPLIDLDSGNFTHVYALHPISGPQDRKELFAEISRILCEGGQALVAMPLRGSFQEIADLFREYGLKHDDSHFSKALEAALVGRPSIETLSEELEEAGLDDIDVEIRQTSLSFDSGRAFIEDPVSRLMIIPEVRTWLEINDLKKPLEYVRDAI